MFTFRHVVLKPHTKIPFVNVRTCGVCLTSSLHIIEEFKQFAVVPKLNKTSNPICVLNLIIDIDIDIKGLNIRRIYWRRDIMGFWYKVIIHDEAWWKKVWVEVLM